MSRFGAKKGGRKLPGAEFTWDADPNGEPDGAPTPLYPKYTVPRARPLSERELLQVNLYRDLRDRFHDGPYYSVLDAASSAAKKGSAARASFDPFHGMPSYSGRYQKKKRALPLMKGRAYALKFFPRELWPTIQPNFKGNVVVDGYTPQTARSGIKRGFEDDDEEEDDDDAKKRQKGDGGEDGEGAENEDLLEDEEGQEEEEIIDDDFEDDEDEMGGDYNAEQYFDGGDDEFGDDGFGDGGGGGEEDTY
ncbi:DNA-directed RNA polymerase III subunit C31 [Aspergillus melleus]|uniref:DNA-directed RNA polymerase III subunit C31 n=1 Tax=Aspergillus melleus TaxID=138277 RepID=A0ACC3B5Y1_9EURO|nr:DNA-directed RNA polymerase III subunit C31 [Aspergillus melleus]